MRFLHTSLGDSTSAPGLQNSVHHERAVMEKRDVHLTSQAICRELSDHHQLAKMPDTEVVLLERNKAIVLGNDNLKFFYFVLG